MELYHALNRGVDKRNIFTDEHDLVRFVHDLHEFNDASPAINMRYRETHGKRHSAAGRRSAEKDKIVDIHGWCLMKNHYHLLVSERVDGGLTLFLRKLNIGYAKYFNERHGRTGTLFQGRTKKVLIERDAHFLYILHYIHLNPLDFLRGADDWREGKIKSIRGAVEYLQNYRWSSYPDYCGQRNFPSILTTDLFADVFRNYEQALKKYLGDFEPTTIQASLE